MKPHIITEESVTIFDIDETFTCPSSHPNFLAVIDAIRDGDFDAAIELANVERAVSKYVSPIGAITVTDGEIFYKDKPLHNSLTTRILSMMSDGFEVTPMLLFLEKLMANPSKTAIDELYLFLEGNSLPITPEGNFLAYKAVRDTYMDIHSGTFSNTLGSVCSVERNQVDDDRQRTCSYGLHFTSLDYAKSFGGSSSPIMVLEINPADVVSIPYDYNNQKGRCCKYTVVAENYDKSEILDEASVMSVKDDVWVDTKGQARDARGRFASRS